MTTTPEQIEAALAAFALASGLGIFPNDEKDEEWREDLVNGMRAAIDTMRPVIRAEALEEAEDVVGEVGDCAEVGAYIAVIRALKEKP
jgi:hypothetical protein